MEWGSKSSRYPFYDLGGYLGMEQITSFDLASYEMPPTWKMTNHYLEKPLTDYLTDKERRVLESRRAFQRVQEGADFRLI